jgi:hypothetical protein
VSRLVWHVEHREKWGDRPTFDSSHDTKQEADGRATELRTIRERRRDHRQPPKYRYVDVVGKGAGA